MKYVIALVCAALAAGSSFGQISEQKITSSDLDQFDGFGNAVRTDGERVIVGAASKATNGNDSGAVYIFRFQQGQGWIEEQKLTAFDAQPNDLFGVSVDIEGDLAVVGASGDVTTGGARTGSVYLYRRDINTGVWEFENKFEPFDGISGDRFGFTVGVSVADLQPVVACGAFLHDDPTFNNGVVYFYEFSLLGEWDFADKVAAEDANANDSFARSMAIDKEFAIVGSYLDDDLGGGSGAAYVFRRAINGSWIQIDKLRANDGTTVDNFGWSVDISGDLAIVGSYYADTVTVDTGAAYIFERVSPVDWVQVAKLIPPDGLNGEEFGYSVSIDGDYAIVGSRRNGEAGSNSGAAYLYGKGAFGWAFIEKITPTDAAAMDEHGNACDIIGDTAFVASWRDGEPVDFGALYAYSSLPLPPCGDLNDDQIIDPSDLSLLLGEFGTPGFVADLNGDGTVDASDLSLLLGVFGQNCP